MDFSQIVPALPGLWEGMLTTLQLMILGVLGGVLVFGFIGIFLGPVLLALGDMLLRRWLREESSV